jgi:hypothetical protein
MAEKRVAESAVVAGSVNSYLPINLPTYLPTYATFYHAQKGNYSTHTKKKNCQKLINSSDNCLGMNLVLKLV